jgi:hypothetical protein
LRALAATGVVVAVVAMSLVGAEPAGAELAVLVDGRVLKVDGFDLQEPRVRFELPGGGSLTMSLDRVERIVEDEIVPEGERLEEDGAFMIAFSESDQVPDTPYGELIFETARRHEINPDLVAAMVRAESAFDPAAVSPKGARGLLQLMPATAQRFGVERDAMHDPVRNLDAGVRYLKWLGERFDGELPLMLAGYNAGEGMVDRYDGVPPFRETNNYIKRIYGYLGLDESAATSGTSR